MLDLTRLENLEFRAVELLAKAMPAASRQKLSAALDSLRATKRRLLARNPSVLRKLRADPAPQDKPNAPMPDAELKPATRIFHNAAMAGMRLLTGSASLRRSTLSRCFDRPGCPLLARTMIFSAQCTGAPIRHRQS
jgi:hypothetical protein